MKTEDKKYPPVEELMKLIAVLNRWSNTSSSVAISYMPARVYTAQDESHLDDTNWGWAAGTTICGTKLDVGAQGKTLEEALWRLAVAIPEKLEQMVYSYKTSTESAKKALDEFKIKAGL